MKILLCCEHFHPSVGGVQKMMYEIGLRFVRKGYEVSVATSWRPDRFENSIDGIKIISFKVKGNSTLGISGEIDKYQTFLKNSKFDFLLVMAAQQWTLDAMLPILDDIPYKKLHIPCGYSAFYLKKYKSYYARMDSYLRKFDHLIYNSTNYRDIDFARSKGISQINIIPAGASEFEFMHNNIEVDREEFGIGRDDFLYLSVGAPAFNKGHKEILQSYLMLNAPFNSTLVLNGNYDPIKQINLQNLLCSPKETLKEIAKRFLGTSPYNIRKLATSNNNPAKKIIFLNLEREKLIPLFFDADLFLFASHVEYSPLVIFECLAAGLPFLSTQVGNIEEIVEWSGGGVICDSNISKEGYSSVDPAVFCIEMQKLSLDTKKRDELSTNGRQSWMGKFTWGVIADKIEKLVT